ncbi:hypothetical protein NUW58_g5560 [Xylaria curta]|uniref:Uncharacterized protein n=1 Tax=Xylaria curta TaxID=42375 RepID=A0ACC1P412_9PEZI|nr:hypothetical protein NUW58_g5560 [Xylaria curta]
MPSTITHTDLTVIIRHGQSSGGVSTEKDLAGLGDLSTIEKRLEVLHGHAERLVAELSMVALRASGDGADEAVPEVVEVGVANRYDPEHGAGADLLQNGVPQLLALLRVQPVPWRRVSFSLDTSVVAIGLTSFTSRACIAAMSCVAM